MTIGSLIDKEFADQIDRQRNCEKFLGERQERLERSFAEHASALETRVLALERPHDLLPAPAGEGVVADGPNARVMFRKIYGANGVWPEIGAMATNRSGQWPTDSTKAMRVHLNDISYCKRGIVTEVSDTRISQNMVARCSKYGLHVARSPSGTDASNVQSIFNHYYGSGEVGCYNECGGFHSVDDEFADSAYGYFGTWQSWDSSIHSAKFFHCWKRCAVLNAEHEIVGGKFWVWARGKIHSDTAGVELNKKAERTTFIGCRFIANWDKNDRDTEHKACVASFINNGADWVTMQGTRFKGNPSKDSQGNPLFNNQRGMLFTAPIEGGLYDCDAWGYVNDRDIFLEITEGALGTKGVTFNLRGPTNQKFAKWPPSLDRSNKIYINGDKQWGN